MVGEFAYANELVCLASGESRSYANPSTTLVSPGVLSIRNPLEVGMNGDPYLYREYIVA